MLDITKIPLNDKQTYELFATGRTTGLFQLESNLGKHWCKKLKPNNINDLSALVALLRPGTLRAMSGDPPKSMTQRYCDRKNGLEETTYYHEALKPILSNTYGILCFQEQSMKIAQVIAGFHLKDADTLRKSIGKKDTKLMAKVKTQFLEGCEKTNIVTKEEAEEIFGWIQQSQRYAFNASHSCSYAINSYRTAYCKAHYPKEFFTAYLIGSAWKSRPMDEIVAICSDAKYFGIEVIGPDLRAKNSDVQEIRDGFTCTNFHMYDGKIRFGLSNIKGIGESSLAKLQTAISEQEIVVGKEIKDWDWHTLLIHLIPRISSTTYEALIHSGALDWLGVTRSRMLFEISAMDTLSPGELKLLHASPKKATLIEWLEAGCKTKKEGGICHREDRIAKVQSVISLLKNPPHSLADRPDWVAYTEEKVLGVSLTTCKVDGCEQALLANTTIAEYLQGKSGYMVFAAEIKNLKEVRTKNGDNPGQKMAFLDLVDNTGTIEGAVIFPDAFRSSQQCLYNGNTVLCLGERGQRGLILKKLSQI